MLYVTLRAARRRAKTGSSSSSLDDDDEDDDEPVKSEKKNIVQYLNLKNLIYVRKRFFTLAENYTLIGNPMFNMHTT